MTKFCKVEDCSKSAKAAGYCDTHYRRMRRNGDLIVRSRTSNLPGQVTRIKPIRRKGPSTAGYTCPSCENDRTEVKDSRAWNGFFRRRRVCSMCQTLFSTIEVPVEIFEGVDLERTLAHVTKTTNAMNMFIAEFNSLRRTVKGAAGVVSKYHRRKLHE